uniref:Uncharacterized protein n=1 Tax=Anguilla anguilla TaxID=7936 RepID=A0A0E9WV28_ANGAN
MRHMTKENVCHINQAPFNNTGQSPNGLRNQPQVCCIWGIWAVYPGPVGSDFLECCSI